MKSIFLRIDNTGLFYNDKSKLPWSATNLPAQHFVLREHEPIHWEVGMMGYDRPSETLKAKVLDFGAPPEDFRPELRMKHPIKRLIFEPLEADAFKALLTWYEVGPLLPFLLPALAPASVTPPAAAASITDSSTANQHQVNFTIPLQKLTFGNGGVSGSILLPGLFEPVDFRISNDHLVAEFDHIKPFFSKALRRKTIQVFATLSFSEDQARLTRTRSPQVERINGEMLEIFRARALRSFLTQDRIKTVDKGLFTPEEVFDSLDDASLGKAMLPAAPDDLLSLLLEEKGVRNARQLHFLAGQLHQPGTKVRYVLSPSFGFVFLAIGQEANHFILELLNSHATYIWSIPKYWESLDAQYRAVEKEITAINTLGRAQYRRTLHFEHEFWHVIHEAANSGLTDGFPRWKNRLLEGLV